jgi:hypothetical protein
MTIKYLPYLTRLSITESFSKTVDPAYLRLPSLVHLAPGPIETIHLNRYLSQYGNNLHTLDLRSPHTKSEYNFLYQYIHKFLSHCPVIKALVLSYPRTHSHIAYQPSYPLFGAPAVMNQSLCQVIIAEFTRRSDLIYFQDLGGHLSRKTFPSIEIVYVASSPTYSSKAVCWIIQEARKRFFGEECGSDFKFEGLLLPCEL